MTHVHPHELLADTLRREMPDIDDAGVELTRRVMRLAGILHDRRTVHSARWNLAKGEVNVLATLRSVGSPFELRPTDLQARLLLSSGGISNVLNRLERNALVERQRESNDGRSCWVRLTGEGPNWPTHSPEAGPKPRSTLIERRRPQPCDSRPTHSAKSCSRWATTNHSCEKTGFRHEAMVNRPEPGPQSAET